jgi:NitT/TauT family transport system substrate-binding protein
MSVSRGAILVLAAILALSAGVAPSAASGSGAAASTASSAALAPALPTGGESSPAPPQRTRVKMGMILSIGATAYFITMDRGYFAAEGIELEYEPIQVTSEAIAHVASGTLDLAIATVGAAVLNSFSRGLEIRILSGVHGNPPSGPGGDPMIARKDLYDAGLIRDATGLKGRRVAGNSLGVFTEYAINGAMATAGLSIDDVEFVAVPFPDIPNALANQHVDAAFVPEPAATAAMERGVAVQIIPEFLRGAQITVLVAGPTFMRDRAVAEGFMRAYIRGLRDLASEGWNSPSVAQSIERYTRVPAATAMKILPEYADPDGRINWDSLMDQQRFYMRRGYLNYSELIDLPRFGEDGPRQAALASLAR